jgi:hypothetical protein
VSEDFRLSWLRRSVGRCWCEPAARRTPFKPLGVPGLVLASRGPAGVEIAERSQIINEIKVRGGAVKASRVTAHPSYADACHQSIDVTGIAIGR